MTWRWPFVSRWRYQRLHDENRTLHTENHVLRDALREANNELRKHRTLISSLRSGRRDVTEALERIFGR